MKSTTKKISLIALISLIFISVAIILFMPLKKTDNNAINTASAATVATTSTLTLSADKTALVPGDTFNLTATFSTTRTDLTWNAITVTVGPYDGIKTINAETCKYFSVVSKTINFSAASYSNVTTDKFAAGTGLYLAISNTAIAPIQASTDCVMTFVIKVSEDITGVSSILFGMPTSSTNATSYEYGSVTDKANTGALAANSITFTFKEPSNDATLSDVKIGHGSASTSLEVSDEMSFTGNSATLTDLKVMPTANDSGATIKIGSIENPTTSVSSGSAATVALTTAPAKIYIDVTAENGTNKKTYIINYTNSFVQLSNIVSSGVTTTTGITKNGLATAFAAATKTYTVYVPNDATSVNVTPTVAAGAGISATVAVSATDCTAASTVNSGSAVSVTGVKDGSSLTLTATAADGSTTAQYTLNFQTVSVDTGITLFTMTGKDDGATYTSDSSQGVDYYFALPYEAGNYSGKFNITTSSDKASVKVGTAAYSSATVYTAGNYSVVVTAEAGNTKTYSVSVVKTVISADFTTLKISFAGTDSYTDVKSSAEYDAATTTYTKKINVSEITASTPRVYIGGTTTPDATVTQTGLTSTTGPEEKNYYGNLSIGTNTYTVKATSSAGSMTYTFVITYVEENNAITNIALASGSTALEGYSFDSSTTTYNINVPFSISSVTATVTPEGKYSYVYRDSDTRLTTNSYTKTLSVGANSFTVYAKADNGLGDKGTVYTFNISRTAADTDALLNSLTVTVDGTAVSLDPTFSSDVTNYTVKVDNDTFSASIAATASSNLATVSGTISNQSITLTKGTTTNTSSKTVTVKSESGGTTSYTITFVREIASATFTTLGFSTTGPTGYSDVFSASEYDSVTHTFTKTYNVKDITSATPRFFVGGNVSRDASATQTGMSVNSTSGNGCTYNYYADLKIGENIFTVTATSSAGNMTYTFKISYLEQLNSITSINLTDSNGALEGFTFNQSTLEYNLSVPYKTTSVTFSVKTDGIYSYVYDGSDANKLSQNSSTLVYTLTKTLVVGENTIQLYAKADTGLGDKGSTYTIKINRQEINTDANLNDLTVKINGLPVDLTPAFSPDVFVYNILDDSDSLKIDIEATPSSSLATVTGTGEFTISPSVAGSDTTSILTVTVTAEDGSTQDYKIYVSKNPVVLDSNYEIASLTIVGNDGVTYFSSNETTLTFGQMPAITVPYLVERINVSATTISSTATLMGNIGNVELSVGENTVTVYAYAEDGTNGNGENKYVFTVVREEPASSARLSDIQINDMRLDGFNSDLYDYIYRVESETLFVSLRAIAEEERAQVSIQRAGETLNSAQGVCNVFVLTGEKGETVTVTITVVIDDLISTYTVRIMRSTDKPVLTSLQVGDYSIYNKNGVIIDGTDESVVSKMTDFYIRLEYSGINNIIIQATTGDASAQVRIVDDEGMGICISSVKMESLLNENGGLNDVQIAVIPEVGEVAVYYVHFVLLTSSTNANITIDEITSFNEQYSIANTSIVYGNYVIPYTMSDITVSVEFDVNDGFAAGTYQIYYNSVLKNDNGAEVSNAKLNYGVNYVLVNLTSSDGKSTKTIVVLVEREQVRLESVSIEEIQDFATEYSGEQTEYFYSVANDIDKLTIEVTVASGYTYAISDNSLKSGINQIKIYIYENAAENAKSAASLSLTADAIEQNALKVIYLNVFREQAATPAIWKIIFYALIALCALLLLIIILMLIFRPRRKDNNQQQAPIIINTPPGQAPQPPRYAPPRTTIVQAPPQYVQPQPTIVQAPPQYVQPQPTIVQAPPQYVQPQPTIVQAPPQYVQDPQQPKQPLVQPIIINTSSEPNVRPAQINAPNETVVQRRVIIRKDGVDDIDGFYEEAGGNGQQ